jgi:hypothetical protein
LAQEIIPAARIAQSITDMSGFIVPPDS